jgi:hypothetical protein
LTRPPMISGKPVRSLTLDTGTPPSLRAFLVPPVLWISKPSSTRPVAKSTRPVLSWTDRIAFTRVARW